MEEQKDAGKQRNKEISGKETENIQKPQIKQKQNEKEELTDENEDFDITEIYTTLSEAEKEIKRRWEDKELRKKVEEFLGEIPEPSREGPRILS